MVYVIYIKEIASHWLKIDRTRREVANNDTLSIWCVNIILYTYIIIIMNIPNMHFISEVLETCGGRFYC